MHRFSSTTALLALGLGLSLIAGLAQGAPRFVLVGVASDETACDQERVLAQELALVIDDLGIARAEPPRPDFGALPVAEQVEALRGTVMDPEVIAAGWLDAADADRWRMVLVFAGEGRAVVQLVEAAPGVEGLPGLALAAREVLAAALPLEPAPAVSEPAAGEVPQVVPPRQRRFALEVGGHLGWGVAHEILPSPAAGGALGAQVRIVDELWIALVVAIAGASEPATDTSALTIGPRLHLAWLPGGERVGVGPTLAFQVAYVRAFGGGPESDLRDDSATRPSFEPGVAARLRLAPRVELAPSLRARIGPQLPLTKGRLEVGEEPALDLVLDVGLRILL